MPISALVITLSEDPCTRESARLSLSREAELWLGPPVGARLPAIAETATLCAGEELVERMLRLSGVDFVDVVSVDFSDLEA